MFSSETFGSEFVNRYVGIEADGLLLPLSLPLFPSSGSLLLYTSGRTPLSFGPFWLLPDTPGRTSFALSAATALHHRTYRSKRFLCLLVLAIREDVLFGQLFDGMASVFHRFLLIR